MNSILEIPLELKIEGTPTINLLRVELSAEYDTPFALVRYALGTQQQSQGLCLDLGKQSFIDNTTSSIGDSAKLATLAPKIVEIVGSVLSSRPRRLPYTNAIPVEKLPYFSHREYWKIGQIWRHLGPNSKNFLWMCAKFLLEHSSFTFDELASATGAKASSLQANHRNVYRAVHAEKSPDPFQGEKEEKGMKKRFKMPLPVRDTILDLATTDPELKTEDA